MSQIWFWRVMSYWGAHVLAVYTPLLRHKAHYLSGDLDHNKWSWSLAKINKKVIFIFCVDLQKSDLTQLRSVDCTLASSPSSLGSFRSQGGHLFHYIAPEGDSVGGGEGGREGNGKGHAAQLCCPCESPKRASIYDVHTRGGRGVRQKQTEGTKSADLCTWQGG